MLIDEIRIKMNEALKNGEHAKKTVYSSMLGALTNTVKANKNQPLNEAQEIDTISKMLKQTKETLTTCPPNRVDIIDKCNFEIAILNNYLPKQMDESEIKNVIEDVLSELGMADTFTAKNKGIVMKSLMPKVKGKADGKLVNKILETYYQ